jgi:hypothetical protein
MRSSLPLLLISLLFSPTIQYSMLVDFLSDIPGSPSELVMNSSPPTPSPLVPLSQPDFYAYRGTDVSLSYGWTRCSVIGGETGVFQYPEHFVSREVLIPYGLPPDVKKVLFAIVTNPDPDPTHNHPGGQTCVDCGLPSTCGLTSGTYGNPSNSSIISLEDGDLMVEPVLLEEVMEGDIVVFHYYPFGLSSSSSSPTCNEATLCPMISYEKVGRIENASTSVPTASPTSAPTASPIAAPSTDSPTRSPTAGGEVIEVTNAPTAQPTQEPTQAPTMRPTEKGEERGESLKITTPKNRTKGTEI